MQKYFLLIFIAIQFNPFEILEAEVIRYSCLKNLVCNILGVSSLTYFLANFNLFPLVTLCSLIWKCNQINHFEILEVKVISGPFLNVIFLFSVKISNQFSFKTTWPFSNKFQMQRQAKGEKAHLFGLSHITRMAALPMYGKKKL